MRELINKYPGECKKCGMSIEVGTTVMYEKSMGIFCKGCEPKDTEEIRHYRTLKAGTKADRLEGWAAKREEDAKAKLNSFPSMRHDWAFITQPGHIPARARMIKADERAYESLKVAEGMRERAKGIRNVRVAGDAARRDEEVRERNDLLIQKGSRISDIVFGEGTVVSIFKKSYRIQWDRSGNTWARDKIYVKLTDIQKKELQC